MMLLDSLPWLPLLSALFAFVTAATEARPQQAVELYASPVLLNRPLVSQAASVQGRWMPRPTIDSNEPQATLLGRQNPSPASASPSAAATTGSDDVVVTELSTAIVPPAVTAVSSSSVGPAAPSFDPSGGTSSSSTSSSFVYPARCNQLLILDTQPVNSQTIPPNLNTGGKRDVNINFNALPGDSPEMSTVTVTATPTVMVPLPTDSTWWSEYWAYKSLSEMAASLHATVQSPSSAAPPNVDAPQTAAAVEPPMIVNINFNGAESDIYQGSSSLLPSTPSPTAIENIVAPIGALPATSSLYVFSPSSSPSNSSANPLPSPPPIPSPSPPPSPPPSLPPRPPPTPFLSASSSVPADPPPATSNSSSRPILVLIPEANGLTSTISLREQSIYQYIPMSSNSSISTSINTPAYSPPPNATSPPIFQYTPFSSNSSNSSTRTRTVMIVVTLNGTSFLGNATTTQTALASVPNDFMNLPPKPTHTKLIVVTVTNSSLSPTGGPSTTSANSSSGVANLAKFFILDPSSASSKSSAFPPTATWDPTSNKNIAVYFGQAPNTAGSSVQEQCEDPNISIVILAYITEWDLNNSGYPQLNLGSNCPNQTRDQMQQAPGLWDCDRLVPQITYCQSIGKKVLMSIGGNSSGGATQFDSVSQAESRANLMWNLFGAGNLGPNGPNLRPFGNLALDGFDVASVTPDTSYWSTFGTVLRNLFLTDKSKQYLLTASPQCVRPDPAIPLDYIKMTDIVIVQSYQDNDCAFGLAGWDKNLIGWAQDVGWHANGTFDLTVNNVAPPRVMIGAIAWNEDRQSGWINSSTPLLEENIAEVINMTGFGGMCLWDGAQAQLAAVNQPVNYTEAAYLAMRGQLINGEYASALNGSDPPPSSSAAITSPTPAGPPKPDNGSVDIVSDAGTISQIGTNKMRRRMYGMKKLYFNA